MNGAGEGSLVASICFSESLEAGLNFAKRYGPLSNVPLLRMVP